METSNSDVSIFPAFAGPFSRWTTLERVWRVVAPYLAAAAATGVAFGLTYLWKLSLEHTSTILFVAAVIVSTWFGGLSAGLFSIVSGTLLAAYFFIDPGPGFGVDFEGFVRLSVFTLVAGLVSSLLAKKRSAEAALLILTREQNHRVNQRTADLRRAHTHMSAICYTIAHDFRAPLRAMQGLSQALLEDYGPSLDETAISYMGRISRSASRLDQLIEGLLAYANLGRQDYPLGRTPLTNLVGEAVKGMESEIQAARAQVVIDFPLPTVIGNRQLLQFILRQFISNALKFSKKEVPPKIEIFSEIRHDLVRLSFRDNGIGMEARHRERIFGVFERLHAADAYEGVGIGLALARVAAEKMHGHIGVESSLDQGSTFWIDVPGA